MARSRWIGSASSIPSPTPMTAILLIDYPGYGACQGSASRRAIRQSTEAAFACLAQSLHTRPRHSREKPQPDLPFPRMRNRAQLRSPPSRGSHHICSLHSPCMRDMARRDRRLALMLVAHSRLQRSPPAFSEADRTRPHPPRVDYLPWPGRSERFPLPSAARLALMLSRDDYLPCRPQRRPQYDSYRGSRSEIFALHAVSEKEPRINAE